MIFKMKYMLPSNGTFSFFFLSVVFHFARGKQSELATCKEFSGAMQCEDKVEVEVAAAAIEVLK